MNSTLTGINWLTFNEVLTRNKYFADGLLHIGLEPKSTFGIYSINTPEYTIAEYGCYHHSIIVIPIYETLGSNICAFIAKQATLSAIFCDTLNRVESVLHNAKDFEYLKHIIVVANEQQQKNDLKLLKTKAESIGLNRMCG